MVQLISLLSVCDLEARVFNDSGILSHANHLPNIVKTQLSFLTVPGSFKIDTIPGKKSIGKMPQSLMRPTIILSKV